MLTAYLHRQDFGQHGRELITSELGLKFMRTLADPEAVRSVLSGDRRSGGAEDDETKRGEELLKKVTEQAVFKVRERVLDYRLWSRCWRGFRPDMTVRFESQLRFKCFLQIAHAPPPLCSDSAHGERWRARLGRGGEAL